MEKNEMGGHPWWYIHIASTVLRGSQVYIARPYLRVVVVLMTFES